MKKLFIVLFGVLLLTTSCSNIPTGNNNFNANSRIINAVDTTGYYAAKNLKGLELFNLGETTYNGALDVIKSKIRVDYNKEYNLRNYPPYYSPKTKYSAERFSILFEEIQKDTICSLLDKKTSSGFGSLTFGSPDVKFILMREYYIGDLKISNLKLTFFKDTLCKIECDQNTAIEQGFKDKYGEGNYTKLIDIRTKRRIAKNEQIIWRNSVVFAKSWEDYSYKYKNNILESSYNRDGFIIEFNNREVYDNILKSENNAYKIKVDYENNKKQKDLNKL